MKRRFRLNKKKDFTRVRRLGKSHAHPLIVLISLPNELDLTRIGVAAGRSLGGAVQRNRAKRRLRAAVTPLLPSISPGWDVILLARRPLLETGFQEITTAVTMLIRKAGLSRH